MFSCVDDNPLPSIARSLCFVIEWRLFMAGRPSDPEIAHTEDNLASLSEIEQAAQVLLARLRTPADREEAQRILSAMERIRTREQARRARSRQEWK
jgi:hypothetical protein